MFRELGGLADPVADLRAACLAAVASLAHGADEVVVAGGTDAFTSSPFRGAPGDPLSIRVGRRLLSDAGAIPPGSDVVVRWDATSAEAASIGCSLAEGPGRTALLVMGDLSARRATHGGPGLYDERAAPFDALVERALAVGDPAALAGLDIALAVELLVAGRAALQVLSGLPSPVSSEVTWAGAPYGLGYVVARWTW
ncbi:MAG: hypothetical protein ABI873_16450 [Marmoricola sp.]